MPYCGEHYCLYEDIGHLYHYMALQIKNLLLVDKVIFECLKAIFQG